MLRITVLTLAALSLAAAKPDQKLSTLRSQAASAFRRNDFVGAAKIYDKALKQDPSLTDFRFWRGVSYSKAGDQDKAIADFNEVIRQKPTWVMGYIGRGISYTAKGMSEKAFEDLNKAVKMSPRNASAYRHRADLEYRLGRSDEALTDYNKAVALNPKDAYAINNRASIYSDRHDYGKAIADYNACLRLRPDDMNAKYNRALCYYDLKQFPRALDELTGIIRKYPNYVGGYASRASVYLKINDRERAIADATKAASLPVHDDDDFIRRGWANKLIGAHAAAAKDYVEAVKRYPNDALSRNGYAWLLLMSPDVKIRNIKEAMEQATRACELSRWQDARIIDTLAAAYAMAGDFESAIKYQKIAIGLESSESPKDKQDYIDRLRLYEAGKVYVAPPDEI